MAKSEKYVRPDSKGRITLGKLAQGVVQYKVQQEPDGKIVLFPEIAIPADEMWIFKNKKVLNSIMTGLEQSANGETVYLGSFAEYGDEE
ncbi:MAG: hypothetical protein LBJ74_01690 [Heliobacteriaceae bacterium]|nr:hypothetical protein [Heliobacteriaceae bacterium]